MQKKEVTENEFCMSCNYADNDRMPFSDMYYCHLLNILVKENYICDYYCPEIVYDLKN